jgi:predicted nuclease of predicted toxin-antitoxin system
MTKGRDQLLIRLYIDEDISDRLVELLRARGYEAESAWSMGTIGLSDEEHLALAVRHGWTFLTCNRNDFLKLDQRWYDEGREHAGIVISQQFSRRQIADLFRQVCNLLDQVTADEIWNTVRYLQSYR